MLLVGIVGKPNAGKSSFFKAITLLDVKIADYPFTTIEPNHATGYVTAECPCKRLETRCNPRNSQCVNGARLIPVELLDVAGLVPDAHLGKGMGNQFLDDLRRASALIHVLDASGTSDENGRKTSGYDPAKDVEWLENEIDEWIYGIIKKLDRTKDIVSALTKQLTGLGIKEDDIKHAHSKTSDLREMATLIRKISKPILIAANKMDLPAAKENYESIKRKFSERLVIACCADYEIALRLANKAGIIDYFPGAGQFSIKSSVSLKQKEALEKIKLFLKEYGSTGVQPCLNRAVFEFLDYIVIYPVENENNFSDSKNNILPDAYLVPRGTTAKQFAGHVHTDFEKNFICAIDARTKMRISSDHELKNGDIIRIVSAK
ncbi:MAG: redox-regulated ATPase YchF [Candidatus Aenigmatarchaeota archaeon]